MKPTRMRIIDIATRLFYDKNFDKLSVAEICREVGIANSVFYYYFENKEQLFREILDGLFNTLDSAFGAIHGSDIRERLYSMISIHIEIENAYHRQMSLYREGEFRYPEYDHALRAIYHSSMELVFQRQVSLAEYYFFHGGLRFLTLRYSADDIQEYTEDLVDLLSNGVLVQSGKSSGAPHDVGRIDAGNPRVNSRHSILQAGQRLFSEQGIYATQVSEITQSAGYSIGLFYKLFKSKDLFLSEVLSTINGNIIEELRTEESGVLKSPILDSNFVASYIRYCISHPEIPKLLREAEFLQPAAMTAFYARISDELSNSGESTGGAPSVLAIYYAIGVAHYLASEILYSEEPPHMEELLPGVIQLLALGISFDSA